MSEDFYIFVSYPYKSFLKKTFSFKSMLILGSTKYFTISLRLLVNLKKKKKRNLPSDIRLSKHNIIVIKNTDVKQKVTTTIIITIDFILLNHIRYTKTKKHIRFFLGHKCFIFGFFVIIVGTV